MGEQKILECQNLRKRFGKKEILKDVSLEAKEGDRSKWSRKNNNNKINIRIAKNN